MKKLLILLAVTAAVHLSAQVSFFNSGKDTANRVGKTTTVNSDVMDLDLARNRATFMGNVIIDDPDMTLTCRKMVLVLADSDDEEENDGKTAAADEKKKVKKDEFNGKRLLRIECIDDVKIIRKNDFTKGEKQTATAGKAVYLADTGAITLTINPLLERISPQGKRSRVRGTRITLYVNSERMEIANGHIETDSEEFMKNKNKGGRK